MTRREAKKLALNAAGCALVSLSEDLDSTLYSGMSEADALKVAGYVLGMANRLGRRFARLVAADVRKARSTPEGT